MIQQRQTDDSEKDAQKPQDEVVQKDLEQANDKSVDQDVTEKSSCDTSNCTPELTLLEEKSSASDTTNNTKSDQGEVSNDTDDNMHYMKQRLLNSSNSSDKSPAPTLAANIDVTRSVTDQIAKLTRTDHSTSPEEENSSSSKTTSPKTSSHESHQEHKDYRNHNTADSNVRASSSSAINSHAEDHFRSSSRASEHSNSGCSDERRPGSRIEDIRNSSKNSPATSPLVIDKAEPVNPYRDPELMKKNTVHSNVHGMLGAQKYPNVHTPIPSASPAVTMPTTTSYPSHPIASRSHVLPSLHYPPAIPSALGGAAALSQLTGIPPGLAQLDQASIAALQQQQLAAMQYQLLMSQRYANPATNLTLQQMEHLWQQKYPSVPMPYNMLTKNHEDMLSQLLSLKEREVIERERIERIERERERLEREKQIERERQERIER